MREEVWVWLEERSTKIESSLDFVTIPIKVPQSYILSEMVGHTFVKQRGPNRYKGNKRKGSIIHVVPCMALNLTPLIFVVFATFCRLLFLQILSCGTLMTEVEKVLNLGTKFL